MHTVSGVHVSESTHAIVGVGPMPKSTSTASVAKVNLHTVGRCPCRKTPMWVVPTRLSGCMVGPGSAVLFLLNPKAAHSKPTVCSMLKPGIVGRGTKRGHADFANNYTRVYAAHVPNLELSTQPTHPPLKALVDVPRYTRSVPILYYTAKPNPTQPNPRAANTQQTGDDGKGCYRMGKCLHVLLHPKTATFLFSVVVWR